MKRFFVAFGGIGFLVFSGLILLVIDGLQSTCYVDIVDCKPDIAGILVLGVFSTLSLASFIGGLANSEVN